MGVHQTGSTPVRRDLATKRTPADLPATKGVIRAYWGMYRGRLVSYLVLSKGLLKLSPGTYAVIARKIRRRAEVEYFYAREKKLAVVAQRLRPVLWVGDILMPRETHRLRVALERCQHLASLQRADEIVRESRRLNHLGREINRAAKTARNRPVSAEAVDQLRAGIHVLELHRPDDFRHLAAWRGREEGLLAQLVEKLAGPGPGFGPELHNAAHLAGRIGYLLTKERQTSRGAVPPNLRS